MSAAIRFSCEGHRHGQPCRGSLSTGTTDLVDAYREAGRAGWRLNHQQPNGSPIQLCYSLSHDEQEQAS